MTRFTPILPEEIPGNPFRLIGKDWMLITAGDATAANTMTASWGGLGVLWNKPVSFAFVRPTRYTYEFLEKEEYYTLSFFGEEARQSLKLCGTVSGRDGDKIAQAGLTLRHDQEAPFFDEARLVRVCRKIAIQDMDPSGFLDSAIHGHYNGDHHRIYTGEIIRKGRFAVGVLDEIVREADRCRISHENSDHHTDEARDCSDCNNDDRTQLHRRIHFRRVSHVDNFRRIL